MSYTRRGMGQGPGLVTTQGPASGTAPTLEQSYAPYQCNWFQNLLSPSQCASAESPTPMLPGPAAPSVSFTVGAPDPNAGASAPSGTTSDGQQIYMNAPTAQQIQAAQVAGITSAVSSGYVDCSSLWNQLVNSQCPCQACGSLQSWAVIGGIGFIAFLALRAWFR